MFNIVAWAIYGLVVGFIAKWLHPGDEEPAGILPTIGIGIVGSYLGGFLAWILGMGSSPLSSSGLIFGIMGAVLFCYLYQNFIRELISMGSEEKK